MRSLCTFLFLILTSSAWCETTILRAKWMLDVKTGEIIANPVLVIENDKIKKIGTTDSVEAPDSATVIDLKDSYLLPGLIDAHVHLAWAESGKVGIAGADAAEKTLLAGFTTVRNPGSTGMTDLILRDAIEKGKTIGPRMFVSGPGLGAKQGVCDQVFAGEGVIHSPQEATQMVAKLARQNVDFIKFCAGGQVIPSVQDISSKELEDSIVQSILFEARKHRLKVAAHAQGPDAILQAASSGVSSIEHGSMMNYEAAMLMKKNSIYLVPTLYRLDWLLENVDKTSPERKEQLESSRAKTFANIAEAISLGVPIAFGTDATVIPHGFNAREFSALIEVGMTPLEAIQTATINAADLLGWNDRIGRIEPGYFADVIAVSSNPLTDIKTLENVLFVMKNGKIYKKSNP
jgi:imidazolonepropionase-like amidohydrolase